jgi:hypothetical protein
LQSNKSQRLLDLDFHLTRLELVPSTHVLSGPETSDLG